MKKVVAGLVGLLGLVVVLAACGADPTPTPTATPRPLSTATPTPTPELPTIKLKFLSGFGPQVSMVPIFLFPMIEKVAEVSDGKLTLEFFGPDAVPLFEQFRPVQQGLFDMHSHHSTFHAGFTTIGAANDVVRGDQTVRDQCGLTDTIRKGYEEQTGVYYLGPHVGGNGWRLYTNEKIDKADFSGLKIRGTPIYKDFYDNVNATITITSIMDVYSALEKGIVDGFGMGGPGAYDFKWYEQVDYEIRPHLGEVVDTLTMNMDSWNNLPGAYQDLLTEVVLWSNNEFRQPYMDFDDAEHAKMVELSNGRFQKLQLSDVEGAKLIKAWQDGVLEKYVLGDEKNAPYEADIRAGVECVKNKWPQDGKD